MGAGCKLSTIAQVTASCLTTRSGRLLSRRALPHNRRMNQTGSGDQAFPEVGLRWLSPAGYLLSAAPLVALANSK